MRRKFRKLLRIVHCDISHVFTLRGLFSAGYPFGKSLVVRVLGVPREFGDIARSVIGLAATIRAPVTRVDRSGISEDNLRLLGRLLFHPLLSGQKVICGFPVQFIQTVFRQKLDSILDQRNRLSFSWPKSIESLHFYHRSRLVRPLGFGSALIHFLSRGKQKSVRLVTVSWFASPRRSRVSPSSLVPDGS